MRKVFRNFIVGLCVISAVGMTACTDKKDDNVNKDNIHEIIEKEIGLVFNEVLLDAGVYKCTEEGRVAFMRFVEAVNS